MLPPVRVPPCTAPKPPRRPLPQPPGLTPGLRQTASAILADLRNHAEELVLSEADVEELVPGVAAWLEREVRPGAIRHALATDLPGLPGLPGLPERTDDSGGLGVVVVEASGRGYARPTGRGGVRGRRVVTTRRLGGRGRGISRTGSSRVSSVRTRVTGVLMVAAVSVTLIVGILPLPPRAESRDLRLR